MLAIFVLMAYLAFVFLITRSFATTPSGRYRRKVTKNDVIFGAAFSLLPTMLAFMVAMLICIVPVEIQTGRADLRQNLQAMNDSTNISGRSALFGGYINESPVYYYYQKNDDGSFSQRHVDVSNARVFESDGESYVIKHCDDPTGVSDFWLWPIPAYDKEKPYDCDEADFYIPKGSITSDFNLDLEK